MVTTPRRFAHEAPHRARAAARRKAIADLGLVFEYLGPDEFGKKWVGEQERLKKVLTETGILEQMKSQKK